MEMAERLLGLVSYLAPWLAKDAKKGSAAGLALRCRKVEAVGKRHPPSFNQSFSLILCVHPNNGKTTSIPYE